MDKGDDEALAKCKYMRRYEEGIEPHPGPGAPGKGTQRPTVRMRDVIHKVGCTFSHHSCKTVPVQGGGGKRRAYICGTCRMKFVQNDPAEEGFVYGERRPVEQKGARKGKKVEEMAPPEKNTSKSDTRTRCLGDTVIRFHNAGGLACPDRRRKYLRRMFRGVDMLGLCETSWEDSREADARRVARWDPRIQADLYTGGQYKRESGSGRNAGLALLVRRGGAVKEVVVRKHGDESLQCMIVDMEVQGERLRLVLTHGNPHSDARLKEADYRRVVRAVKRVNEEDRAGGAKGRKAIWMADHNMVKDKAADEERGTKAGARAHQRLVEALEEAEAHLSGEGGMVDVYRATHKEGARGYTHGVRRIDRAAAAPSLMGKEHLPRVEGVEHVPQDLMEIAVHTANGWEVRRPHHKAVDITLRFSEEKREGGGGWSAGRKEGYPGEVWERAMGAMRAEVGRRVEAGVAVREGGGVVLSLRTTRAEERQGRWEGEVREVLEEYEKGERKGRCKKMGGLRADRDRLLKAAAGLEEGSARRREMEARAQRRDRQIQVIKIQLGMAEAEKDRQGLWGMGKDQKATHEVLRGGGKVGKQQDIMSMEHPVEGEVTGQADILDAFEKHMSAVFNLGERESAIGGGEGGAREEGEEGTEGRGRAERGRAEGKSRILGCIRAHVAAKAGGEVEGAMGGLRVGEILEEENIDKAITQIKKGTVGGEDGFDTTFYAIPEVRAALIDHLGVMYREIKEDKRMPESMRCAGLSMLYKGKGRSPKLPKSYRPIAVTNSAYRILMKAIQLKLAPATTAVVGKTQMAYLTDGRRIWDNTLLLAGVARQMESEGKGGAAVQVDNTAAFDRVRWDFLQEVMEAMGFPEEFREFIGEIYTDLQFAIKVNGQKGGKGGVTNGVRQGCPASPLIFIIVQEALLMAIRGDEQLKGIRVVTGGGGGDGGKGEVYGG